MTNVIDSQSPQNSRIGSQYLRANVSLLVTRNSSDDDAMVAPINVSEEDYVFADKYIVVASIIEFQKRTGEAKADLMPKINEMHLPILRKCDVYKRFVEEIAILNPGYAGLSSSWIYSILMIKCFHIKICKATCFTKCWYLWENSSNKFAIDDQGSTNVNHYCTKVCTYQMHRARKVQVQEEGWAFNTSTIGAHVYLDRRCRSVDLQNFLLLEKDKGHLQSRY